MNIVTIANQNLIKVKLSKDEKKLDERLTNLKKDYINSTKKTETYQMNVLEDEKIWNSDLYKFMIDLPKGGDTHVHGIAMLPVTELINFLKDRDDIVMCPQGEKKGILFLSGDTEKPANCVNLGEALKKGLISESELKIKWSSKGVGKNQYIWDYFETMFSKDMAISYTTTLLHDYYYTAFKYYCSINIFYVEFMPIFFGSHEQALTKASAIRQAYYDAKKECPSLVVRMIPAGLKHKDLDFGLTEMLIDNAIYIRKNLKDDFDPKNISDFVVAIDLVNEEDASHPLKFYEDFISKIKKNNPDLKLTLHAGESLLPDNNNIIDAYRFGASRIGHGINLYRFPELIEKIKKANICLNVCPICNRDLGYVPDLRSHPAVEYFKRGVSMTLSSDDPAYLEHTILVDDYFAATVCWNLGIAEIKQLCMNSIDYSLLSDKQKTEVKINWNNNWNKFVKAELAK